MSRRQAPWMCFAQEGDVLKTPSGDYRVIRSITRFPDGDLRCASFAIRRCSWTGRGYTTYNFTDLMRWEYVLARDPGTSEVDRALYADTHEKVARPPRVTCCQAVGVP